MSVRIHSCSWYLSVILVAIAGCAASSVSVAVEEVPPEKWTAEVFLPDIQGQADKLVKKPGYDPLAEPV